MDDLFDQGPQRSNLNFFFTLDAILNAPSLTEAGRRANLSQPAISIALKKAREHFGDPLIVQQNGERHFTGLAVELRPRVRRILLEAQQVLNFALDFDPAQDQRTFRITMPDFVEVVFLPRILSALRRAAPGIRLRVVPFEYREAARHFEGDVDFVILPSALAHADFGKRPLYDDHLSVMISRRHPKIRQFRQRLTSPSEELYLASGHVAVFDDLDILAPVEGGMAELMRRRNVVVWTSIYSALPALVFERDLIATTSSRFAQYYASILPLIVTPPPKSEIATNIVVQWQRHRASEPGIAWFLDLLTEAAQPILGYEGG